MSNSDVETIIREVEALLAGAGPLPEQVEQAVEKLLNVVEALTAVLEALTAVHSLRPMNSNDFARNSMRRKRTARPPTELPIPLVRMISITKSSDHSSEKKRRKRRRKAAAATTRSSFLQRHSHSRNDRVSNRSGHAASRRSACRRRNRDCPGN